MKLLEWKINLDPKYEEGFHYRANLAFNLKDEEPLVIIKESTFDGVLPDISINDIEELIDFIERSFLKRKIEGVGLEVGAGPATFSSILAKRDSVREIYAVEICRPMVELLMPKISNYVLGEKSHKVIGAIGDFDSIELPNESIDFIFDFFSFHHSDDLAKTLKECYRVLKKSGFVLCLDKARPNNFNKKDLDELLDTEYGENFKRRIGIPINQKLTRRMNDEKEYRLKDWTAAFKEAGFAKVDYFYLDKTSGGKISRIIKSLISLIPPKLQVYVNKFLPEPKHDHKFILSSTNRVYSRFVNPFRKEISLLIAYK